MTPTDIETYQTCRRLWKLSGEWAPPLRHPTRIFRAALNNFILGDLQGEPNRHAAYKRLKADFVAEAARPGIRTSGDPYTLTYDYVATLIHVAEALYSVGVPRLVAAKSPVDYWESEAMLDESSGELHRWAVVEAITPQSLAREARSWRTLGEVAQLNLPINIHMLAIGPQRGSHLHSAWCKTFAHESIHNRFAFQRKDGSALVGKWRPVWAQDLSLRPEEWVDAMKRDNIQLFQSFTVQPLAPNLRERYKAGMLDILVNDIYVASGMKWWECAPSPRACNAPPCQYEELCYSPVVVGEGSPKDFGFVQITPKTS